MATTLNTEIRERVCVITLTRAGEYNTITPTLARELAAAVDDADANPGVNVILLRAEGPAFCAGYGLDWATVAQSTERSPTPTVSEGGGRSDGGGPIRDGSRVWDSVSDMRLMNAFVDSYLKLWYADKPTVAAAQGWCIAGGTDMVLCCDLIIAGEGATFGYPPARVWGTPTTAMWVYRMGLERAKRYLLTGDEIPAPEAARIGLILEAVPDDELDARAMALATRMAKLPQSQLVMLKLLCNQTVENMGMASTRTLGTLFDGIARHTQEGVNFVTRATEVGFREAVRERDDPFQDYGSRPK